MHETREKRLLRRLSATALFLSLLAAGPFATSPAGAAIPNETCDAAIPLDTFPSEHEVDLRLATPSSGPELEFICRSGQNAWFAYDAGPAALRFFPLAESGATFTVFGGTCDALEPLICSGLYFDSTDPVELRICDDGARSFRIAPVDVFGFPVGIVRFRVEREPGPPDLDEDGLDDCTEVCPDVYNPGAQDGDEDGVPDACDNCVATPNPDQQNADFDDVGDACDGCPEDFNKTEPGICGCGEFDYDKDDGVIDCVDNCPRNANPDQADRDGDETGDVCDPCPDDGEKTDPGVCGCNVPDDDPDGDGYATCIDECPEDGEKPRPGFCGCGVPEADPDGDGVALCIDNCPDAANADQEDLDGDGLGDRCECASGGCVVGGAAPADCSTQLVPPVAVSSDEVVRCAEGDPCDRDPEPGRCRIPIALCFAGRTSALPSCTSVGPRTIEVGTSAGASLDALLALSSLPGARAIDQRRVRVDPWPSGLQVCTAPFELTVARGELRLNLSTFGPGGGPIDADHFRVRCEEDRS